MKVRGRRLDPPSPLVSVTLLLVGLVVMVVGYRLVEEYRLLAAEAAPKPVWVPASGDRVPSAPAPSRSISLVAGGDVLIHPQVWQQAATDAKGTGYDFFPMLQQVSPVTSGADLALCHLETPIGDGPPKGFPRFRAPEEIALGLKKAGFDTCSTASDHTLDHGVAGVTSTIEALDAAGLGHSGSYRSEPEAGTPTLYDVRGVKVGHLSYTLNFNGLKRPPGKEWIANLIEPEAIRAAARAARAAGAEIVVLSLHWGTEYRHAPDANQQRWAKELIASPDIDLILGHHAHVVQPYEKIGDEWVVYGMGNQLARHAEPANANREGVLARITFTETGPKQWRAALAEAVPIWVDISPRVRLVHLPAALADPATPPGLRATYQAAYDRITAHLLSRGAGPAGLVISPPSR